MLHINSVIWLSSPTPFCTGLCSCLCFRTRLHPIQQCMHFFSSASFPDLCCLLQLITLILDKLLPSYTRRQAHCRLCKHQNHVKCAVQTCKLVVQAQLLLCTTYLNVLALHRWDTPHCSEEWFGFSVTVNWILRQAKNTAVLHPRINASHDQHAYMEICK